MFFSLINKIRHYFNVKGYKYIEKNCYIPQDLIISKKDNLIMKEGAELETGTVILNINSKFIMGKKSGAGPNLTVVAGNHMSVVGKYLLDVNDNDKLILDPAHTQDKDVIIEDDVWLGANVTLLNGVVIGRGAIVAAGTVCRSKIPPYTIVLGNPAKVVGFRFTPEQIIEHERSLYHENDRLSHALIEKNYKKYYLDRLSEINEYCRI